MSPVGRDERYLEFKVGAMILVALGLLVGFLVLLGDWSLGSRKEVEVYFQNPGGLSPGAAVKVAGRGVGKITEMTFLGQSGPMHPATKRPALVRARIDIDEDVYESMREDASFYITTKGVLGDPYLEIDPGVSPKPVDESKPLFGTDPPRLDLIVADAAELIDALNHLLERNADNLDQLLGSGAKLAGAADRFMSDAGPEQTARFDRIVDGVESLVDETRSLVTGAREKYVDDPGVARTLDHLESLSTKLDRDIDPLVEDVRSALEVVDRLGETLGPEELRSLKDALGRLDEIASRADTALDGVNELVERMRRGEGTVGALMADEEVYDELKELLRNIKKHPWKLIWKD